MKAQPGPMVSGSHFFPKAPLLWVKWMPAWAVMSRKVMVCASPMRLGAMSNNGNTHHGDAEARRNARKERPSFSPCLRVSVVDFLSEEAITFEPQKSWWRLRLDALLQRCSRLAAGPTCARGCFDVRCCLRD